jgi:hypothetical protein
MSKYHLSDKLRKQWWYTMDAYFCRLPLLGFTGPTPEERENN